MPRMIRKQIYIRKRQQAALTRLARARGTSEAEVIRQALEREGGSVTEAPPPQAETWEAARRFMASLEGRGSARPRRRPWRRDDLYAERLSRYERRTR
jgi:hypothetical protein